MWEYVSAQGILWFTEDIDEIINGTSGTQSSKYIATVELSVKNTVGWPEYDKYLIAQLKQQNIDSVKLDKTWIVFDPNNTKIIKWEQYK